MRRIQKIAKWATLLFFGIALFTMTLGQAIPIEFADWRDMHLFYDVIIQGLPIVILLTLVWTLTRRRSMKINIGISIATLFLAGVMFIGTFFLMFSYGFGAWVNQEIVYEKKDNLNVTINKQIWDIGALGYGGRRTVKLTPVLGLWHIVTKVDTATIDKQKWTLVQKQGDIKFP